MQDDSSNNSAHGNNAEQLDVLERALNAAPQDPSLHRAMSDAKFARGDELGALAHLIAAQTLESSTDGSQAGSVIELCNVATGYFMKGEYETAARWYQLVLTINPNLAIAYQNLATIYSGMGRSAEAESCREQAYQIQRVFIEQAGNPSRSVLILGVGRTSGNVPFENLFPTSKCCRIKYAIDYAADEEDEQLPPFDLVFNAIGEPDVAASLADRLERFAKRCDRPILNPPAAVSRTQRHRLGALLGDLEDVVAVPCQRYESPPTSRADLVERLSRGNLEFPVLARPAASHGGEGLARCENIEALENWLDAFNGIHYLTNFYDYRSADGNYRKYRIIFVDREPFPYHLAISSNWMVHYFSADMAESPSKIDEERRFLESPLTALGAQAMAAVAAIGRRLDLDYGGIDFALLPDKRVLIFEANATMLVHHERHNGGFAYRNSHVQCIVDSFERLQVRRSIFDEGTGVTSNK
jgi:tetratricopeptide (TPR) repeat protein